MKDLNTSIWANREFIEQYRENADIYIIERQRMISLMNAFYRHFLDKAGNRVLDLGCGDGILSYNLYQTDPSLDLTLLDASEDMLARAAERLRDIDNKRMIHESFQNLISKGLDGKPYDFVVSSMAIHHLPAQEKKALFEMIYRHLNKGGYFLNVDVVIARDSSVEEWYMHIWESWMDEKRAEWKRFNEKSRDVISRYKKAEENQPDTLEMQLGVLRDVGFRETDCHYKYGIFTVYGGKK